MKFGSLHHVTQTTINVMYQTYAPVFILTTGRSGSKFLTALLNHSPNILAYHEPRPTLQYFPNFVYHHQHQTDMLKNIFDASRMELILDAYNKEKIFVESNQCLTFFAPVIQDLFPKSKFIHILRHPGNFVRSAVRKGWYMNDSIWEAGRIKMDNQQEWERLDQIEQLSWLWATTHQFIEAFKSQLAPTRILTMKIENIFTKISQVQTLLTFVGAEAVADKTIRQIQKTRINELHIAPNEPQNMKKIAYFPQYQAWDMQKKNALKKYAVKLATLYGYTFEEPNNSVSDYTPLVSVIIPNHNNEKYIAECLDSVLNQTYPNIEIIISDDCSTDNSREIIQTYQEKYPERITTLHLNVNRGVARNRNYAIEHAKGEYITTLDSDDYYYDPRKLEKEMELLLYYKQKTNQNIVVFSDIVLVTNDGKFICHQWSAEHIKEGMIFEELLTRSCMIPRDFVVSKSAYGEIGGYNPIFPTHEDWDLKIRLATRYKFYYTGITGTAYRQHGQGLSSLSFREKTHNLRHVFNNNIEIVSDNEQKRKLVTRFGLFLQKRQQEYIDYLKSLFREKSREESFIQVIIFGIRRIIYDFGLPGFLILLSLFLKKMKNSFHRFTRWGVV